MTEVRPQLATELTTSDGPVHPAAQEAAHHYRRLGPDVSAGCVVRLFLPRPPTEPNRVLCMRPFPRPSKIPQPPSGPGQARLGTVEYSYEVGLSRPTNSPLHSQDPPRMVSFVRRPGQPETSMRSGSIHVPSPLRPSHNRWPVPCRDLGVIPARIPCRASRCRIAWQEPPVVSVIDLIRRPRAP